MASFSLFMAHAFPSAIKDSSNRLPVIIYPKYCRDLSDHSTCISSYIFTVLNHYKLYNNEPLRALLFVCDLDNYFFPFLLPRKCFYLTEDGPQSRDPSARLALEKKSSPALFP